MAWLNFVIQSAKNSSLPHSLVYKDQIFKGINKNLNEIKYLNKISKIIEWDYNILLAQWNPNRIFKLNDGL